MNDRELLELAAKAAGIPIAETNIKLGVYPKEDWLNSKEANGRLSPWWNPLVNDGDALRLAVRLAIRIDFFNHPEDQLASASPLYHDVLPCEEAYGEDQYAATRRAIVRAAAEIGKAMK